MGLEAISPALLGNGVSGGAGGTKEKKREMRREKLGEAEILARDFLVKVHKLQERLEGEKSANIILMLGCKESASVRRASMDLTRALAELRKPH